MDARNNAVRTVLREIPRRDAEILVKSFGLSESEERCVLDIDCVPQDMRKSTVQLSIEMHVSEETIKRRRNAALSRIAAELNI